MTSSRKSPLTPLVPSNTSKAQRLAMLPAEEQQKFLVGLTDAEAQALLYDWSFLARPSQLPPAGNWHVWLLLAGRGFGKTRTGAEWVRSVKETKGRLGLIAPTAADVRDVMVEGESGIIRISPPWDRPLYEPSKRRLTWANGAQAALYSADEPERLRGPQHDALWCDEIAAWRYAETWDMAMFGLRLGSNPQAMVTTTPKPIKIVRDLLADSHTAVTRGSTYDNKANLAPSFLTQIVKKYEGTRLGRQELNAELLEDTPGSLWNRGLIEEIRRSRRPDSFLRVVVAIDPAVTSGEDSDETGIVVAAIDHDQQGWVLADLSGRYQPHEWGRIAVSAYREWRADRVIAEVNNGGDLVEATLRVIDPNVSYRGVRASRGKVVRAEPISALYEQRRVYHLGSFSTLEDQMCAFTVDFDRSSMGYSPDRLDALVWAFTELMLEESTTGVLEYYRQLKATKETMNGQRQPS